MTEEPPPSTRTSTRATRGTKHHPDDFVYYGDKKLSKEPKTPLKKVSTTPKTPLKTQATRSKTPARRSKTPSEAAKIPPRTPRALKAESKDSSEITDPLEIPNDLNILSEAPRPDSATPMQPIILTQNEKEELKCIEQNLKMGKKGFKRRGRPKLEDYDERKENLEKIKILKEQGQLDDIEITPQPRPPKKPRKSSSCAPPAPNPIVVVPPLSTPVTRIQTRKAEAASNPAMSAYSKSYCDVKPSSLRNQPKIVSPFENQPKQSFKNHRPLIVYPPRPSLKPSIRFLKPQVHSLNSTTPRPLSNASKMAALKDALFIQRPASAASTSSNGSTLEKENVQAHLHVQTNSHAAAFRPSQTVRPPQPASPSIITFANYPNNLLALEPNVKYCLVNQNGKLIYPASELQESSFEPETSASPSTHRFFEPRPNYFLTVL